MAMLDDPEWLLQHIRHSFITSDDTGMCEMVLQGGDMMTLGQHRDRIKLLKEERRKERAMKNKKKGLPETFGQSTPVGSLKRQIPKVNVSTFEDASSESNGTGDVSPIAPSPDIQSGWDFGGRRRSNTAQKLERIKREKQNRVKVNSVPWRKKNYQMSEEDINDMFRKKELKIKKTLTIETPTLLEDETNGDATKSPILPPSTSPVEDETPTHCTNRLPRAESGYANNHTDFNDTENGGSVAIAETNHDADFSNTDTVDTRVPRRTRGLSVLSKLLTESAEQYNNPFREYSRFDAEGQSVPSIRKVNIYVWSLHGTGKPKFPLFIHVLARKAKVNDVIGLACWKYSLENCEPTLTSTTVHAFELRIADDDGTVDTGFPRLDANEPFFKFDFTTLALVEQKKVQIDDSLNNGTGGKRTQFVKVNDHEGFSMVKVDSPNITMGEILRRTLLRRKGRNFPGKYFLEHQDRVGEVVSEDQTLESTHAMEFYLVREHSSRAREHSSHAPNCTGVLDEDALTLSGNTLSPVSGDNNGAAPYKFPPRQNAISPSTAPTPTDKFIFIPTTEYVTFRLFQVRKIRSSYPVDFGVGMHQVDIVPVERRDSKISNMLSAQPKTLTIRVGFLAHCEVYDSKARASSLSTSPPSSSGSPTSSMSSFTNQDPWPSTSRLYEKKRLKLYYRVSKTDSAEYKQLTFEGIADDVQEAVDKVCKVMELSGDKKLQTAFRNQRFGVTVATTTTSSSNDIFRRRGSLFR